MKPGITYETQTCGRCGGSGHHSFNLMHGTVCFGCSGSGKKFTRRGATARKHVEAKRDELYGRRAADVKPGDRVFFDGGVGVRRGWHVILESKPDDLNPGQNRWWLMVAGLGHGTFADQIVRVWNKAASLAVCEYASTLKGVVTPEHCEQVAS